MLHFEARICNLHILIHDWLLPLSNQWRTAWVKRVVLILILTPIFGLLELTIIARIAYALEGSVRSFWKQIGIDITLAIFSQIVFLLFAKISICLTNTVFLIFDQLWHLVYFLVIALIRTWERFRLRLIRRGLTELFITCLERVKVFELILSFFADGNMHHSLSCLLISMLGRLHFHCLLLFLFLASWFFHNQPLNRLILLFVQVRSSILRHFSRMGLILFGYKIIIRLSSVWLNFLENSYVHVRDVFRFWFRFCLGFLGSVWLASRMFLIKTWLQAVM